MVKLRLRRKGRRHLPIYDIVALDSRKRRDGAFIERLGYYDPNTQPSKISVNADRAIYWLNVGAQPTQIVRNLLSYEGVLLKRRLLAKGTPIDEISSKVEEHKRLVRDRYFRNKEQRKKQRLLRKKSEAEETVKEDTESNPS